MLEELLSVLNNWFDVYRKRGVFEISDGSIYLPFLQDGQYFRIVGSVFNDGLHLYPADDLENEIFTGEVWALAVPKAVKNVADEIEAWIKEHPEGEYVSESFGGYSYTKSVDSTGAPMGWRAAFRSKLARWKKI